MTKPPFIPMPTLTTDHIWYLFKHNTFIVYADDANIPLRDLNSAVRASFGIAKERLSSKSLISDVQLGEISYTLSESQESTQQKQSEPSLPAFPIQVLPKLSVDKENPSPKSALSVSYPLTDRRYVTLSHTEQNEYLCDLARLFVLMNAAAPLRDLREESQSDVQVMPNWTFNANPSGACTTGGPGSTPTPPDIPYPYKDRPFKYLWQMKPKWDDILAQDDTSLASTTSAQANKKVRVIVLDSVPLKQLPIDPQRSELDQAITTLEALQARVNAVNPANDKHPYLAFLQHMNIKQNSKNQYIHWAEDFNLAAAQELKSLEDLGDGHHFHILNHSYEMRDHGLFIASIIESLLATAPGMATANDDAHDDHQHDQQVSNKVEYHLIEVLNQYGVGTLQSLTAGIRQAINLIQQDTTIPTIINCSLMLSAHNDLGQLIAPGAVVTDSGVETESNSLLQEILKLIQLFIEYYDLNAQVTAAGGQAIMIASAGNRMEPVPVNESTPAPNDDTSINGTPGTETAPTNTAAAPDTRFPASSPHVIGVGALDADGNPADYSYLPDRPANAGDKTGKGVLAFGGDDIDPQQGVLGLYLDLYLHERDANILYTRELYGCAYWAGTSFASGVTSALCAWLVLAGITPDDDTVYGELKKLVKDNSTEAPKIKLKKKHSR